MHKHLTTPALIFLLLTTLCFGEEELSIKEEVGNKR